MPFTQVSSSTYQYFTIHMKMEFRKHGKKIVIIMLHKCGQSPSEIIILLKLLIFNRLFVFCTVKRYNKMGDIFDRLREECLHFVCLPNVIHAFCERVRWNPQHKYKWMAAEMSVSLQRMSRILQVDLKLDVCRCYLLCCSSATIQAEEISKHPLCGWEDFFYAWKIESSGWQSVCTMLLKSQGEDTTGPIHAPSPIRDDLVVCIISWHYPNSLLWAGSKYDKKVYQRCWKK